MGETREKLARWLESNPDSWLTQSYVSIGKETGVSPGSVDRYLPELIADRDGIMPSEVLRKRKEARHSYAGRSKVDPNKILELIKENPDADIRDLAYLAKCHPRAVKKVLDSMNQEPGESQNTGKDDQIRDIDAEIEALQKRRSALSKN